MNFDADELFNECLAEATMVVKQARVEELTLPTPDPEWNVRDLLQHMLQELVWVPDVVEGKTIEEVGDAYEGDLFGDGDDIAVAWESAAVKAERAVDMADLEQTAHLSYGDVTVEDYLRQVGPELLIHAWDVGQAIGVSVRFDDALAREIYEDVKNRTDDMQSSGLFAPPLDVSEDASIEVKLLGLYGRSPDAWREAHR